MGSNDKSISSFVFDIVLYIGLGIAIMLCLYPLLNILAQSFSDADLILKSGVKLLPKGFNLNAYKYVFHDSRIIKYYYNTITYCLGGTIVMLIVTSLAAYPLSIHNFILKKQFTIFLTITMFIGGGLIPTYLTVQKLGLKNTYWIMILPGAVSAMTVFVFRTFFQQLPNGLTESASIDGAGHIRILFGIVLPLSKPLLATFALQEIVIQWNAWFNALLYLDNEKVHPIQMLLRKYLILLDAGDPATRQYYEQLNVTGDTVKAAVVIVTVIPILFVYPFFQKYFAQGMLIGSVKG